MLPLEKNVTVQHEEQFPNLLDTFRYLEKYLKTIENGCVFVSDITIFGLHYLNIKWVHCLHPFYFLNRHEIISTFDPDQKKEISTRDLTLAILDLYIHCKNLLNILNWCKSWEDIFSWLRHNGSKNIGKGLNEAFFIKNSQKFKLVIVMLDLLFRKLFNIYFEGPTYRLPWFSNNPILLKRNGINFFYNPHNIKILTNSELLSIFPSLLHPTSINMQIQPKYYPQPSTRPVDLNNIPDSLFKNIFTFDQLPDHYSLPQCIHVLLDTLLTQMFSKESDLKEILKTSPLLAKLKKAIQILFNNLPSIIYETSTKYSYLLKGKLADFNRKFTVTTMVFPRELKMKTTLTTHIKLKIESFKFDLGSVDNFTSKFVNNIRKAPCSIKKILQPIKDDNRFLELLANFIYDLLLHFQSIPIISCEGNIDVGVSVC